MARYTITRTFEIDTDAWNEQYNLKYKPLAVKGFVERRLDEAIDRFVENTPGIECESYIVDLSDIIL
jgi:hypothetical protein